MGNGLKLTYCFLLDVHALTKKILQLSNDYCRDDPRQEHFDVLIEAGRYGQPHRVAEIRGDENEYAPKANKCVERGLVVTESARPNVR